MNAHSLSFSLFARLRAYTPRQISVSLPLANDVSDQTSLKAFSLNLRADVKQTSKSSEHLTVCEMNKKRNTLLSEHIPVDLSNDSCGYLTVLLKQNYLSSA